MSRWASESRFELRILILFVVLTVVPMCTVGIWAYAIVVSEIEQQEQASLRRGAKSYALVLLERLQWLSNTDRYTSSTTPIENSRVPIRLVGDQLVMTHPITGDPVELSVADWAWDAEESNAGASRCVWVADKPFGCDVLADDALKASWPVLLDSSFRADFGATVTTFRERTDVLAGVNLLAQLLPLSTLLTSGLVCWVAMRVFRRRFEPLKKLEVATQRISAGDYSWRIDLQSDDEFESLGKAFNTMGSRIKTSFDALASVAEIDRLMLSQAGIETIAAKVLETMGLIGVQGAIAVRMNGEEPKLRIYKLERRELKTSSIEASEELDIDTIWALGPQVLEGEAECVPISVDKRNVGFIAYKPLRQADDPTRQHRLRDLADRISVAMTGIKRADTLYRQAHFDALTGLTNRHAFADRLTESIAMASRTSASGALLYLDIDRFKKVNDSEGHNAGDKLLVAMAGRISTVLREVDTFARLGGDEFAVIIRDCGSEREIGRVCERVLRAVESPLTVERIEHTMGASIGVAIFPADGETPDELLMKADTAMYTAKNAGGTGFAFYDEALNEATRERVVIESRLRKAIRDEEMDVVFQPRLDLHTGTITGAEALMRWHDAELGQIPPSVFIPIAEESNLIGQFTAALVDETSALLDLARQKGIALEHISINASVKQLMWGGFLGDLLDALDRVDLPREMIEIEVTESLFMEDIDRAILILGALRSEGLSVALDDFGTGFSSFNMLRKLPLDVVKLDRSFVAELDSDSDSGGRRVIEHLIPMLKDMGPSVIAEGVETQAQMRVLREAGCDAVQGFIVSQGIPAADFVDFVANHKAEEGLFARAIRAARNAATGAS